jgi:hypothetical protein
MDDVPPWSASALLRISQITVHPRIASANAAIHNKRIGTILGKQTAYGVDGRLQSPAAPSMLRLGSNGKLMEVEPSPLVEVIWPRPGIAANCCSNGVATDDAMVSGLAPGRLAVTVILAVTPAAWDCSGIAGRFSLSALGVRAGVGV